MDKKDEEVEEEDDDEELEKLRLEALSSLKSSKILSTGSPENEFNHVNYDSVNDSASNSKKSIYFYY